MKRIPLLILALLLTAGCGQSEEPATTATSAPPTSAEPVASTVTEAPPEAETVAAAEPVAAEPAADSGERIQVAQADMSAVEAAGFVEGVHYRRLSPTQPTTTSPDTVEVDEFFMHSCIHCYNLEPYVQAWLPEKPDYIEFVRIPTTWDPIRKMHAQAYYAAVALGKEEEMHMPFFREMHERNNYLQTPDAMAEFFARFDVSREEFDSVFDSFGVIQRVNRADELGRRYRVDSTPTIIVNGKYRTGVDSAEGYERMFELIELLAAAELGR